MTPAAPPARRLSLFGCAAASALALTLSACGSGDSGTPAAVATTRGTAARPAAHSQATDKRCKGQVGGFVKSLEALRGKLAVGLSYEQYAAEVHTVMGAYDEIPVKRLTIDCLANAGTPGEKALNQYIDAANAWGECLAETGCNTASIEPALQRRWRLASNRLSAVRAR